MMDRRQFTSRIVLILAALSAPFSMAGCGIFSDISAWIPTAIIAINGIVSLLGALVPSGAMAIVVLIDAALNSLKATIDEYNADTNPADKATLLAKIRTILTDISTNFQSFLNALNIGNNPIVTIVIGLANIVLSAIAGFLNALPVAAGAGTQVKSASYTLGGKTWPIIPKLYKSVAAFKSDWNEVCKVNNHPETEIH